MGTTQPVGRGFGDSRLSADGAYVSVEPGSVMTHQSFGGFLPLGKPLEVRPKPLGNLKGSNSRLALGVGDSDDGSSRVEIAHLEARDFARAHPEHKGHCGGNTLGSLSWIITVGEIETRGQELPRLVNGKLLLSGVSPPLPFYVRE